MSAEQYRIPPQDVSMSEAVQFAQHWEVRVPVALAAVGDVGLSLQAVAARMRAGDQVTVCAFKDKTFSLLTEVAVYRVVGAGRTVRLFKTLGPIKVPLTLREEAETAADLVKVVPLGNGFVAVDGKGNQLETFVEKAQADAWASRENAKTIPGKVAA